ncbi:MAG: hypothetical protein ACFFE2_07050 [Candidatus Thorarchaeota archaeon]
MQTEADVLALLATNLIFSVKIAPLVVVVATIVRSALLLTGNRRALVSWTRNTVLSIATFVFLPGMLINTAVRYGVCSLLGIDLEGIGGGSTYAELNLFLKVDRPPKVAVLVTALYVSTVASLYIGFTLLFLPVVLLLRAPVILLCWYLALCVLFNSSLRGGDFHLLGAALQKHPGRGVAELFLALAVLIVFYAYVGVGI